MPLHNRILLLLLSGCVLAGWGRLAQAGVIFVSASLGPTGVTSPGLVIFNVPGFGAQFLGARFHLDSTKQITAIGGHLVRNTNTSGILFGAIFPLSGPMAVPTGNPFDSAPLASTAFIPAATSTDFRTPLSLTVGPGDYGLVFGAGLFGSPAGAEGDLITNGADLPGVSSATYFGWHGAMMTPLGSVPAHWDTMGGPNERFVVEGNDVPEPASLGLFCAGACVLVWYRMRRRSA